MEPFAEGVVVPLSAYPTTDDEVVGFLARAGVPGIVDIHVHFMPDRLQQAVWRYFDALANPPWPVQYRGDEQTRLGQLLDLGVTAHTALAYAHQPGMLGWLNGHTLDLADAHPQVIPTFTLYPEDGVTEAAADAISRGGVVCKIHDQLSGFRLDDPRLDEAWRLLSEARTLVVAHTSKVYGVDGGETTSGPDQIYAVRARHPALRLCIAHLGLPDPDGGHWEAIQTLDDVWTDPSSTLTEPPPTVAMGMQVPYDVLRDRLGPKILFGSDFPSIAHPYVNQVRGLAHLQLDPAGLRDVLHGRAATLLAEAGYQLPSLP